MMVAADLPPISTVAAVGIYNPFASLGVFLESSAAAERAVKAPPPEAKAPLPEEPKGDPLADPDSGIIDGRKRPGYQQRLPDKLRKIISARCVRRRLRHFRPMSFRSPTGGA